MRTDLCKDKKGAFCANRLAAGIAALALAFAICAFSAGVAYAQDAQGSLDGEASFEAAGQIAVTGSVAQTDDGIQMADFAKAAGGEDGIAALSTSAAVPIGWQTTFNQDNAYSILVMVNNLRASQGASALVWDSSLELTAMQRAAEITLYFSHLRPSGYGCFTAFPDSNTAMGENIAYGGGGFGSPSSIFNDWCNSSGHYQNMISTDFTSIGIGCAYVDGVYYYVQCFGNASDGQRLSGYSNPCVMTIEIPESFVQYSEFGYDETDDGAFYLGIESYEAAPEVTGYIEGTLYSGTKLSGSVTWPASLFYWTANPTRVVAFGDIDSATYLYGYDKGSTLVTCKYVDDGGNTPSTLNRTFKAYVSNVQRIWGQNALGTMQSVSEVGWEDGSCEAVVVATLNGYWDALSASGLAGIYKCPVLMTSSDALSSETREEIERLGASTVYIAGGTTAVSGAVETQIRAIEGVDTVTRADGDDAIGTSVKLFERGAGKWGDVAIVASSASYHDALAASPYSYAMNAPIFLADSETKQLDLDTLTAIKSGGFSTVLVCGGENALNNNVIKQLKLIDAGPVRQWGEDAIETSAAIANWSLDNGLDASHIGVATSESYYDALSGAALCGLNSSPIVLVNDSKHYAIDECVLPLKSEIDRILVFGGTVAISSDTYKTIAKAML